MAQAAPAVGIATEMGMRATAVDRVLRQSSGEDAVFIHMPNGVGTVLLKPRHKVRCDDLLLGALREVLGTESVVMER